MLAGVLLAVAPLAVDAQRIPERLADSTFWRMITEFSEPGGVFASENFVSNENEWQYVIPGLVTRVGQGGVYVGVGPEQNFTYIAALRPRIAFICDIRRQNLVQHLMYKALFEMSADRAGLLSLLWARPRPEGLDSSSSPAELLRAFTAVPTDTGFQRTTLGAMLDLLVTRRGFALTADDSATLRHVHDVFVGAGPTVNYASRSVRDTALRTYVQIILGADTVHQVVTGGARVLSLGTQYSTFGALMLEDDGTGVNRGWLGSEAAFRAVKDFQARNLLVPIVGDFAGPKALRAIGDYVRAHDARVTTFYVSNVEQYLFQERGPWARFYENVATMPYDSSATFVRSISWNYGWVPPRKPGSRMAQMTASIEDVIAAYRAGALSNYASLIAVRHD